MLLTLMVDELQLLADHDRELGGVYAGIAGDEQADLELRRIAGALAAWRKERARAFHGAGGRAGG
jgi:hypothetical protein